MQLFSKNNNYFFISYVVLVLMNHCSVYEKESMVAVALVQACSAFHNDDPYGVVDAMAYSDASVEEVCDDGDVGDDGDDGDDDSNVAVGDIPHCEYDDILFRFSHIHQMDTG